MSLGDPKALREVMSRFPTGVSVITIGFNGELHGMTANSVTSVSLNPPLIAVAIDNRAYTESLVRQSGHFSVNLLARDQIALSRAFSRAGTRGNELFRSVAYALGPRGDPLILGTIGQIGCRVYAGCPAGDHTLWIGAVEEAHWGDAKDPLVFYHSQYYDIFPWNGAEIYFQPF